MLALGGLLPVAGLLYDVVARPRINQWGATDQEHQATWPGDRLLARPGFVWTNAITIQRPATQVWPWLLQLGQGRGGLYSYDWLENLVGCDIHSADRVLPQFQQPLQVGDRVIRMARYAPPTRWRCSNRAVRWSWVGSTTPTPTLPPGAPAAPGRSLSTRSTSTPPGCSSGRVGARGWAASRARSSS
jgi:hypothetical protein